MEKKAYWDCNIITVSSVREKKKKKKKKEKKGASMTIVSTLKFIRQYRKN
jgi:hypothetical protein